MQEIKTVLALLVAVVALTLAAERLQIAYPIVLVVGGLAIGFIPAFQESLWNRASSFCSSSRPFFFTRG